MPFVIPAPLPAPLPPCQAGSCCQQQPLQMFRICQHDGISACLRLPLLSLQISRCGTLCAWQRRRDGLASSNAHFGVFQGP